jgi:hypothetical protein
MEQLKQLRAMLSNILLQIMRRDHQADVWAMWVMVWVMESGQIAHTQVPENIGRNGVCG